MAAGSFGREPGQHVGNRRIVHDLGDGITDIDGKKVHGTAGLVRTILAAAIEIARRAGDRRERPFQCAHNLADADLCGGKSERIAAAIALAAADEAGVSQLEQNRF